MQANALRLFAVTITFLVLAWVTVSLRCLTRLKITKAFGLDDYLIVISLLVFTAFCSCQLAGIHYGIGRHNVDVAVPNVVQALKYQILCEIFYFADTALIKLSVGFLLRRITPNSAKVYCTILYVSMAILTLWSIITFCIILFQCNPVYTAWDKRSGEGHCLKPAAIANVGYAFSAMDIVFDWMFALLPIPMLWSIKMSLQMKLSLILILGLGVFASTATLVRLKYIVGLKDPGDILYSLTEALMWTTIEAGIGIAAASIATMRPLFRSCSMPGFSSTGSQSHTLQTFSNSYHQSYDLGRIQSRGMDAWTTTHTRALSNANTSQESILGHDSEGEKSTSKRTDIEVSYEETDGAPPSAVN